MAGYIKDTDIYALFQSNGTAHLHVADIDQLPRIGDEVFYIHDTWVDPIEHSFFLQKDYDKVKSWLSEQGKKRYEERYASALKDLEDHEQELEMLKSLLENASDSNYVKSNSDRIKNRIKELPGRIEHYDYIVKNLERMLNASGYIHFCEHGIESVKLEDVTEQNLKHFEDC